MTYRIARNGQVIGTFTLPQLRHEIESGRVSEDDLAQHEAMEEWLPVSSLLPGSSMLEAGRPTLRLFPDPPNLRWWIALIVGVLTLGAFFVVWDVVEAAWLRRVQRTSTALVLYCLALALFIINAPAQWASIHHAVFNGPLVDAPFALSLSLGALLARLVARFVMRNDLCRHFTVTEPIGMQLNWFRTLLFGGLYFQYHFNQVNETKRRMRISVPSE